MQPLRGAGAVQHQVVVVHTFDVDIDVDVDVNMRVQAKLLNGSTCLQWWPGRCTTSLGKTVLLAEGGFGLVTIRA